MLIIESGENGEETLCPVPHPSDHYCPGEAGEAVAGDHREGGESVRTLLCLTFLSLSSSVT